MSSASAAAPPAAAADPHLAGQAQAQGGLEAGTSLRSESPPKPGKLRYITSQEAAQIDEVLMSPDGGAFSIDQLMELAGLSCAQTVHACYPPTQFPNVLVAAGPGNQGGDGLVAARHLSHFGYTVSVWYPKEGKTELFKRLKKQLQNLRVSFLEVDEFEDGLEGSDVVLDTIFGFSFKGEPREPFREPLEALKNESRMEFEARRKVPPIVSVDIPSGWDVDTGNPSGKFFTPQVLVSLTAPKKGVRAFTLSQDPSTVPLAAGSSSVSSSTDKGILDEADAVRKARDLARQTGRHFLGGRFIPDDVEEKFSLALPSYPADDQIVDVTGWTEMSVEEAKEKVEEEAKESLLVAEARAKAARGAAPAV
ncbi:hypothetical protein FA10DRAFT_264038 [Acaromyces ingoldii]|uniref:NAD(P)H-hydrate epimerase n=1 Tax=Acaromyces ingoldii TaxID=215250 RepID=A0A316YW19_9BASI|nr:hypothetical protein FA10DRAFT_264038 [Acaromyces ingoldii]PWN93381.1 hypothetical protein FA10DRAFT_264038 [Acaromyces ingoldii]